MESELSVSTELVLECERAREEGEVESPSSSSLAEAAELLEEVEEVEGL